MKGCYFVSTYPAEDFVPGEAVELALGAAAKVIGQRLDSESDRRIVLDYLAKVETPH